MNVDRAVRRLFVASDKGCTIPYSAEESVLRELKKELIKILEEDGIELEQKKYLRKEKRTACVMALLVLAIIVVGIVGQIILIGGV